MPTPSFDLVHRTIEAHDRGALIHQAIDGAWSQFERQYPERASWRRRSTSAGLVWEMAVDNAIHCLDGTPGTTIVPHHDTVSFIFDEQVFLRVKKASLDLLTANYPTPLATAYHDHDQDLFGFQGLHRVEAAYVLNALATSTEWIGIVARQDRDVLWHFELSAGGAVIDQLPLPLVGEAPAADRVVRLHAETTGETSEETE